MLPRIVLFVLQLLVAWACADWIVGPATRSLGISRDYHVLAYAVVYAVMVWLVGLAGGAVLKEVRPPSTGTLVMCLILAIAFAVVTLVPQLRDAIEGVIPALRGSRNYYPLAGAMLGYFLKR